MRAGRNFPKPALIRYLSEEENTRLNETELAWAAGFFDGEGSTGIDGSKKAHRYMRVQVVQKDRRPLDRFVAAVGVGRVAGPYNGKHRFSVSGSKARHVVEALYPYLSEPKREQIARVNSSL